MKEAVWHVANHQASDVPLVVRPWGHLSHAHRSATLDKNQRQTIKDLMMKMVGLGNTVCFSGFGWTLVFFGTKNRFTLHSSPHFWALLGEYVPAGVELSGKFGELAGSWC